MPKQDLVNLNLIDQKLNLQIEDDNGEILIRLGRLEEGEGADGERLANEIGLCNIKGTTDLIRIDCETGRFITAEFKEEIKAEAVVESEYIEAHNKNQGE